MFIEIKYWYLGTLYVIMKYNNYYVMKEKNTDYQLVMLYDCLVIVIAKLHCSSLVASYIHFINLKQIILFLAGKWLDVCWENCTCIVNKSIVNILWEQDIT